MTVDAADTLAELAAQRIEADILGGLLAPDSRLGIAETSARYGFGATPLREVLSRLAARGLVNSMVSAASGCSRSHGKTSPTSSACAACSSARRSVSASRPVTAPGKARSSARFTNSSVTSPIILGDSARASGAFDILHKQFHASLLAACGSPRLIATCGGLYDEAYRYRRLMMATFTYTGSFVKSHEVLAEAAIERATERAEALVEAHIASTLALVYPSGAGRDS